MAKKKSKIRKAEVILYSKRKEHKITMNDISSVTLEGSPITNIEGKPECIGEQILHIRFKKVDYSIKALID
jgi:hypothetical protein